MCTYWAIIGVDPSHWSNVTGRIAYSIVTVLLALGSMQNAYGIGGVDEEGTFKVGHFSYDAIDAARDNRTLFTEIWYPVDPATPTPTPLQYELRYSATDVWEYPSPFIGGYEEAPASTADSFPLVIFSHGSAGHSYGYSYIGESLASHGYVVAMPNHTGNTWDEYRFWPEQWTHLTTENTRLRLQDVSFVIDEMQRIDADPASILFGAIDLGQVGVAGHSYGANTSLMMSTGFLEVPPDDRVKAIASVDGGWQVPSSTLANVSTPTLMVGGSSANSYVDPRITAVPQRGRVDVQNAVHLSFVLGECQCLPVLIEQGAPQEVIDFVQAGWFPPDSNPACSASKLDINEVQRIANESMVAFFDRTLKLDPTSGLVTPYEVFEAAVRVERTSSDNPGHPLQVLIEDPIGRRIGFDSVTGMFVNEFGLEASFDDLSGQDLHVFALPAMSGDYVLSGRGVAENGYKIETHVSASPPHATVSEKRVLAEGVATIDGLLDPQLFSLVGGVAGDYDFDQVISGADFLAWQRGESPKPLAPAELVAWQLYFGQPVDMLATTSSGVPEPSSLMLGSLCLAVIAHARKR